MDSQLALICLLTFVIHVVGTLAYSVRIAGVRTQRVAISFALFNVLVLVSRTSNSVQAPFLAKRIERNLLGTASNNLTADFRWLLLTATLATVLMFVFIDPQLSVMTDDVIEGKTSEPVFRKTVVWLTGSRLAGTLVAQLLLIPAALLIVRVAQWL